MSLGYTYQDKVMAIGTKSGTTITPATLTADLANNRKSFETGGLSKLEFMINYTTGAGETSNVLEVVIESSIDGTNWYRTVNDTTTTTDSVLDLRTYKFTGVASATAYPIALPFNVQNSFIRVSVKETGVITNFGTVSIEVMLSGDK